jgi:AraC-like DNA-binding protein
MTLCLGPRRTLPALSPVDRMPFRHVQCAPSAAVAPFVTHYWVTRWDRRGLPTRVGAALLDPCVHLQVIDGRAIILGLVRGTYRLPIAGAGCVVGVKFRPGGFYPFFRRPISSLTDRVLPAQTCLTVDSATLDACAEALTEQVMACAGDAAALTAVVAPQLDALLRAHLPAPDAEAERASAIVTQIAEDASLRGLADVVRASGRSERTLQRLFSRYVGASPAWIARRYRLHAAAARLTVGALANLSAIAAECGYADQSHFIRAFRATLGTTPGAYLQARSA